MGTDVLSGKPDEIQVGGGGYLETDCHPMQGDICQSLW